MTLYTFSSAIDTSFSSKLNSNQSENLVVQGLNTIRQLLNRSITYSKWYIDGWGEAYIDATGRADSVTTGTSAAFSTNKYQYTSTPWYISTGSDSFTATSNDSSNNTITTTFTINSDCIFTQLGFKCINSTTASGNVIIKRNGNTICTATIPSGNYSGGGTVALTRADYTDYCHAGDTVTLDWTIGGSAFQRDNGTDITGTYISGTSQLHPVGTTIATNVDTDTLATIVHTIPTGTFSSTISKAIGVPMFASTYESGDNVQFKLTNASEDTGWINYNTITSFTAFTSEPTTLKVALLSTSSGTSTYPEIYGFWTKTW